MQQNTMTYKATNHKYSVHIFELYHAKIAKIAKIRHLYKKLSF